MLQWLIRFPEFVEINEFSETSVPFRKKSNEVVGGLRSLRPRKILNKRLVGKEPKDCTNQTDGDFYVNYIFKRSWKQID